MNSKTVYTLILKQVFTETKFIGVYDSKDKVQEARTNHMIGRKRNDELHVVDLEDLEDFEEAQEEYMILETQLGKADILGITE